MWRLYKTTYDHRWDQPIVERLVVMEDATKANLDALSHGINWANPVPEPTYTRATRPYTEYTVEGFDE